MDHWLDILTRLAIILRFLHSSDNPQQTNTNGTYPNGVDPAAVPGAQFGQSSPPFYPSPWTNPNGVSDWESAYEQAQAFVKQLTLLEKV